MIFYLYAGKIWKNAGGRALILPILSETDMWIIRLLVMRSSASFRIKRISCRNYFSTGLERSGKYLYLRRTATGISCFCRKYGFDGKSLFCIEKTKKNRCLYPRRRDGKTPGPCLCCVWKSDTTEI